MKNKRKTKAPKKTKSFLFSLGVFSVKVLIFLVGALLVLVIIYNFIFAHHNCGSRCAPAESDANNIAAAISDYFAVPEHTTLPTISGGSEYLGFTLSARDDQNIAWVTGDPLSTITIVVQDTSGKCPSGYRSASASSASPDRWSSTSNFYTKIMD